MTGHDETNCRQKLLLTNRQVENLCNTFANKTSDINLTKTQLPITIQSRRLIGRLLGSLLKTGLPLIKKKPLAKNDYFLQD